MLRSGETSSGELLLGAFLCFSTECRFTVVKPIFGDQNNITFMLICHLFGPEVCNYLNLEFFFIITYFYLIIYSLLARFSRLWNLW